MLVVVDTGPLYAAADLDDQDHEACRAILESERLELIIPAMVVAEATYLIGTRLGAPAEVLFLRALADLEVEAPMQDDGSASPSWPSATLTFRSAVPTQPSLHLPNAIERRPS